MGEGGSWGARVDRGPWVCDSRTDARRDKPMEAPLEARRPVPVAPAPGPQDSGAMHPARSVKDGRLPQSAVTEIEVSIAPGGPCPHARECPIPRHRQQLHAPRAKCGDRLCKIQGLPGWAGGLGPRHLQLSAAWEIGGVHPPRKFGCWVCGWSPPQRCQRPKGGRVYRCSMHSCRAVQQCCRHKHDMQRGTGVHFGVNQWRGCSGEGVGAASHVVDLL